LKSEQCIFSKVGFGDCLTGIYADHRGQLLCVPPSDLHHSIEARVCNNNNNYSKKNMPPTFVNIFAITYWSVFKILSLACSVENLQ